MQISWSFPEVPYNKQHYAYECIPRRQKTEWISVYEPTIPHIQGHLCRLCLMISKNLVKWIISFNYSMYYIILNFSTMIDFMCRSSTPPYLHFCWNLSSIIAKHYLIIAFRFFEDPMLKRGSALWFGVFFFFAFF